MRGFNVIRHYGHVQTEYTPPSRCDDPRVRWGRGHPGVVLPTRQDLTLQSPGKGVIPPYGRTPPSASGVILQPKVHTLFRFTAEVRVCSFSEARDIGGAPNLT